MDRKPKILILLPICPFPPSDGGKICSYSFINNLRGVYEFTVLMPCPNAEKKRLINEQKQHWPEVNIVDVSLFLDYPNNFNKVVKRAYNMLSIVGSMFFRKSAKTLTTKNSRNFNDAYNISIQVQPVYVQELTSLLLNDTFEIIQVEYFANLPLVNLLPPASKKLYVEIESRYMLIKDYATFGTDAPIEHIRFLTEYSKTLEKAHMEKYDGILALSEKDKERLQQLMPGKRVYYSPYSLLSERKIFLDRTQFRIEKLVYLGPENHYPNKDGVEWFIEEGYKDIESLGIEFHIIGKWSESFRSKYRNYPKVIFAGFVDDLEPYIANSIHVIPIRLGGGGLRAKNLLCLAEGIPMVSTRLGCEGVNLTDGENVVFGETPAEIMKQVGILLRNPDKAFGIAKNANEYYYRNHSIELVTELRNGIYRDIINNAVNA